MAPRKQTESFRAYLQDATAGSGKLTPAAAAKEDTSIETTMKFTMAAEKILTSVPGEGMEDVPGD